ncbi:MAG: hypothetical protein XD69_1223 [Clostridia bacterium 62_21]|nr:MAG: hypothetical protein XD69_1223 [Clostridia bacterium 62_21]
MPHCTFFKPAGIPLCDLEEIALTVEEVEALRLKDLEGLEQEACAERMGISRPTFQRILTGARVKLTEALVAGKAIKVEGGHYQFVPRPWRCTACGAEWEVHPVEKPDEHCPACGSFSIVRAGPGWGRRHRGRHGAKP